MHPSSPRFIFASAPRLTVARRLETGAAGVAPAPAPPPETTMKPDALRTRRLSPMAQARVQALGLAIALLCAQSATAQTATAGTPPPGRLLASNCFQCHGTNGKGPGFDRLAGKSAAELYKDMLEFRSGKEGNGLMARHSLGYTDAQLKALAQYLSTQR